MTENKIVILAGGQGTRFWPISRMDRPKQFLSISPNGESLIQATCRRVSGVMKRGEAPLIVTNILHESLVREHVPNAEILSEPLAKNTAASIGYAAIKLRKAGVDPVMIILPADHAVQDDEKLRQTLIKSAELADKHEILVTIGIEPSYPNTGYGYIKRGIPLNGAGFMVRRFFEKPNLERAVEYCKSGEFYWNSGMFVWKVSVILEAIEEYMPQLYAGLCEIEAALDTPTEKETTLRAFKTFESTSIDFGVLELARNCAVVPATNFGWNDVGSWDAWAEHFRKDEQGNLIHGDAIAIDSSNSVVYSGKRFIAVVGAEDLIVIDSDDAVLVCPRAKVQEVKKVVEVLKTTDRVKLM